MSYEPLTKIITDENGEKTAVCRLYGTNECLIHKPIGCFNCPVFKAIVTQLNTFEQIYLEGGDDE